MDEVFVIYLTTFFAFRFYTLIPASLAFSLFVALGILCATLAVVNDARILAFLAVVGAFLAPILASTGEGNHITLFTYYAVVNAAIFVIAWFKAWRSLNLAGFGFTVLAASAWARLPINPPSLPVLSHFSCSSSAPTWVLRCSWVEEQRGALWPCTMSLPCVSPKRTPAAHCRI
jgi:uncharacterized membrane protein